jgi:hypothetical protein
MMTPRLSAKQKRELEKLEKLWREGKLSFSEAIKQAKKVRQLCD